MDLYFGEVHHATVMVSEERFWCEVLVSRVRRFWIVMNQTFFQDHNRLCPWAEAIPRTSQYHCMVFSCRCLMSSHASSKLLGIIVQGCTISKMFDISYVLGTFDKDVAPKVSSIENNTMPPHEGTRSLSLLTKLTISHWSKCAFWFECSNCSCFGVVFWCWWWLVAKSKISIVVGCGIHCYLTPSKKVSYVLNYSSKMMKNHQVM